MKRKKIDIMKIPSNLIEEQYRTYAIYKHLYPQQLFKIIRALCVNE